MLLLLPAVCLLLFVLVYPLGYGFWMSLHSTTLITPGAFTGLHNYWLALTEPLFRDSLLVTLKITVEDLVLEFVIGFALALLLDRIRRGQTVYRTLILLPVMVAPVVAALNWRLMLNHDFGVVNYFVRLLGLAPHAWANEPATAVHTVVLAEMWRNLPFVVVVLSAGLGALPVEVLEAAAIDGASFWQTLWRVVVPLLKPIVLVIALFRVISLLRAFDSAFALTGGGPGKLTEVVSLHIYNDTFSGGFLGYAAAESYILLGVTLVISLILIRSIGLRARG